MKTFNTFIYDNLIKSFHKKHTFYINSNNYYVIDKLFLTNKNFYPIIYILFNYKLSEKDILTKYSFIALCNILNENKESIEKLMKELSNDEIEIIKEIRVCLLIIFNFYKIYFGDKSYLDSMKDVRNFISLTFVLFEFIKQNNFNSHDFINKYKIINDQPELQKIKKAILNINKKRTE